jgi:hypothetical protein
LRYWVRLLDPQPKFMSEERLRQIEKFAVETDQQTLKELCEEIRRLQSELVAG